MAKAIVFAYHNVGVRCLSVLLAHNIDVRMVVTHTDNPAENIWFESVRELALGHRIPTIAPDDPNTGDLIAQGHAVEPEFVFSFYYRHLLEPAWLALAPRGALNMHGSLLPKYRGRVPVNWAVINGETETGATLHYMTEQPDAGDIVGHEAVAIAPDDTAHEVFHKVTGAAARVLDRSIPLLVAGTAPRRPQDLAQGSYYGGRKPADGHIDWSQPAAKIHNLVRGVAPPYPGAYTQLQGKTLRILRTRIESARRSPAAATPGIFVSHGACFAACADGSVLRILAMDWDGVPISAADFEVQFGVKSLSLEAAAP